MRISRGEFCVAVAWQNNNISLLNQLFGILQRRSTPTVTTMENSLQFQSPTDTSDSFYFILTLQKWTNVN